MTFAPIRNIDKALLRPLAIAGLIFAVALGIRLVFVSTLVIDAPIRSDAAKYATIAVNLLEHGTYSHQNSPNPTPDAFITPGYPLLLTAVLSAKGDISSTYYFMLRFQAILTALTASIIFLMGRQFLPEWAAIAGGLMVALAPHMITISGFLVTEALFTFLLCSSLFLVMTGMNQKNRLLLFSGAIAIGMGALVRPVYLLFPIVIVGILILDRPRSLKHRSASAFLVLLGVCLVWAPWAIWKSDKDSSVNAAVASFALGSYPNLTFRDPKHAGFPYREDPQYRQMSQDLGVALDVIMHRAGEDPGRYAYWYLIGKPATYWSWGIMAGKKDSPFIYPVRKSIYSEYGFFEFTLWLFRTTHPFIVLIALGACISLLLQIRPSSLDDMKKTGPLLIVGVLLYFTAIHVIFAPLPRYAIPAHPLLYLCGLYAITKLIEVYNDSNLAYAK